MNIDIPARGGTADDPTASVVIGLDAVTIDDLARVAGGARVRLAVQALERTSATHDELARVLASGRRVYGLTTGVGDFHGVGVAAADVSEVQLHMLMSHASGVGTPHDEPAVRAIMVALIAALIKGYSGVSPHLVRTLAAMLNRGVTPWCPGQGSVGYLIATAHIGLVVFGAGKAWYGGQLLEGGDAMRQAGIEVRPPALRDGHALISGTYEVTGIGALAVHHAQRLVDVADVAGALSLEALRGNTRGYDLRLQQLRPHRGQYLTAQRMLRIVADSEILAHSIDERLQDPLSLRCIPQVHGAVRDTIDYCAGVLETELNSVTDNPVFVEENGELVSLHGGNGHGAPSALALDYLAIAIAELSTISQARSDRLTNSYVNGLPPFLTPRAGVDSGFMIPPYVAAAIAAENRLLASPSTVHTVSTCAGQEDHVSMGVSAAVHARTAASNCTSILAVEMLCAAQALEFRSARTPGRGTLAAYTCIRSAVPSWEHAREMHQDLASIRDLIDGGSLAAAVSAALVGTDTIEDTHP